MNYSLFSGPKLHQSCPLQRPWSASKLSRCEEALTFMGKKLPQQRDEQVTEDRSHAMCDCSGRWYELVNGKQSLSEARLMMALWMRCLTSNWNKCVLICGGFLALKTTFRFRSKCCIFHLILLSICKSEIHSALQKRTSRFSSPYPPIHSTWKFHSLSDPYGFGQEETQQDTVRFTYCGLVLLFVSS